jgi:outer membrane putative beta-barrel porin/alpha-amylase
VRAAAIVLAACLFCGSRASASDCPGPDDEIETDRPDVTNSSVVVPRGSVQFENGVDWSAGAGGSAVDGPQSRVRFGAFHCRELLIDVPDFTRTLGGASVVARSPIVLSTKSQVIASPFLNVSIAGGVGLPSPGPSGTQGFSPYLQAPWSHPVGDDWLLSGMLTWTWRATTHASVQPTLAIGRKLASRGDLFIELIGDYSTHHEGVETLDGGGGWRVTPKQQLDFHVGRTVGPSATRRYVGLGYSLRIDRNRT